MKGPYVVFPLRRGLPQYMLPSFLQSFGEDITMFTIPAGDIIEQAQLESMKRNGRSFSWLPKDIPILAVWTDVIGGAQAVSGSVDNMYVPTDTGKIKITEAEMKAFVERSAGFISAVVLPVEQVAYNEDSGANKRARRSVDGILHFWDATSSCRPQLKVYANLCGGGILRSREIAFDVLNGRKDNVDGLFIGGFETFTAIKKMSPESERENRKKVLECISAKLKESEFCSESPKVISFTGWLHEICHTLLYPVIDHICIGSPTVLAALGLQVMLDFRIPTKFAEILQIPDMADTKELPDDHLRNAEELPVSELHDKLQELLCGRTHCLMRCRALAEKDFAASEEPFSKIYDHDFFAEDGKEIIVQKQTVRFICKDYTQAYVHHLLNCREPLAFQLLEWDNWQTICLLFRTIRRLKDERSRLIYLLCFVVKNLLSGDVRPQEMDPLAYKLPETYTVTD